MPTPERPLDARARAYEPRSAARVYAAPKPRCGTYDNDWKVGQQACKGSGSHVRCLRVYRKSDVAFEVRPVVGTPGSYTTSGIQGSSRVYAACAPLDAGRYLVVIDGVAYNIMDSQPPDNCG